MAISSPAYCTREDVKRALDIKQTARNDGQVDQAVESAARSIEGLMHRVFYPTIATRYFDWPNFQLAYPWRIWFDANELADVTVTVPVVTSGGNVIPNADIFWGHPDYSPPYTYLELNRSSNASFGQGNTPQRDVAITGVFGYDLRSAPAGAVGLAMNDTTGTALQVTNGAAVGVGDNILIGTERMLVTDKVMVSTTQTQQSGLTTALNNDVALGVTDGTKYAIGEVLLLDSERLLIVDIAGNILTVKRAWDGSALATHTGATVYAARLLTVTRGDFGSTATTHALSIAITRTAVPGLIKSLAIAEAVVEVTLMPGAYSRSQGTGGGAQSGLGDSLPDLRTRAYTAYGRKARKRVI